MGNKFGVNSLKNLNEAHPKLKELFIEVLKIHDCSVIEGYRSEEEQEKLYYAKKSKLRYPNSKHNLRPSMAVDVIPWPVDWTNYKQFYYFAGIVKGVAHKMGLEIRWGGDWDRDNDFRDQTFHDLPHFELIGVKDADS